MELLPFEGKTLSSYELPYRSRIELVVLSSNELLHQSRIELMVFSSYDFYLAIS